MKRFLLFIVVAALASSCRSYDVYLLIGQSNMAGRGYLTAEDTTGTIDGVYLLNDKSKPEPARHPLNRYSTVRKDIKMQQIGPGGTFGEEMHRKTGRRILLVVNAKGGTSIKEWACGKILYTEAVKRCLEGMKYGKLKGILWLQGCSDSSPKAVAEYPSRLVTLASSLRKDLGVEAGEVPFVAGQLPYWRDNSFEFNRMITHISEWIPNSDWVSTEGCTMRKEKDDPHYSREGQFIIGYRFAEKFNKQ